LCAILNYIIRSVSRPESRTSNIAVYPGPTVGRLLCATTRPTVGSLLTVTSRSESRTSSYGNYTSDSRLYTYSVVSFFLWATKTLSSSHDCLICFNRINVIAMQNDIGQILSRNMFTLGKSPSLPVTSCPYMTN